MRIPEGTIGADILVLITGGTFDKAYDAVRGELNFGTTHLPEILKEVRCRLTLELEINQLKDSLDMDDADRDRIVRSCKKTDLQKIVITHGTDTMEQTAKYLVTQGLPELQSKTIVLTGAMVPYSFKNTDAVFNLGTSLGAVQLLGPGVYICMHGKVFSALGVKKNRKAGYFEKTGNEV